MKFYNFIPVQKGGGVQNASSFIELISDSEGVLAIRPVLDSGDIRSRFKEVLIARSGHMARIAVEAKIVRRAKAEDRCFTLFGPPPLMGCGRAINIVGCAYSNLFYPEIDFWMAYSGLGKIKKKLIDWLRQFGLSRADYWIFETEILAQRAVNLFSFPKERVFVVRMAPSKLVTDAPNSNCDYSWIKTEGVFLSLFLAGAHPNKRLHLLLDTAEKLKREGEFGFRFVLTFDSVDEYAKHLMREISRRDLGNYFVNVGAVKPQEVAALIKQCDVVCNFARLESFSNNFVEAWSMRVPLVVTDSDWSRDACGNGAIYVNPEDPELVILTLHSLRKDEEKRNDLVSKGAAILASYPTALEKSLAYKKISELPNLKKYKGPYVWKGRKT